MKKSEPTPEQRFEQFVQRILAVPKREIDVLMAEYEIAKRKRQKVQRAKKNKA